MNSDCSEHGKRGGGNLTVTHRYVSEKTRRMLRCNACMPPADLNSATAHKTRAKGRLIKVEQRILFGTVQGVAAVLARSAPSRAINTSFVERQNGADRNRNARKLRKT